MNVLKFIATETYKSEREEMRKIACKKDLAEIANKNEEHN